MPMPRAPVRLDSLQSHNQSNKANCSADMEACTYELDCSIGPSGLVLNSKLSPYRSRSSIFFRPLWRLGATSFPEPTRARSTVADDTLIIPSVAMEFTASGQAADPRHRISANSQLIVSCLPAVLY